MTTSILFRSFALSSSILLFAGCNPAPTPTPEPAPKPSATTSTEKPSITPPVGEAPEKHPWTKDQILTCSVSQCWQLANKSEDTFFDIVQDLAAMSAKNRNIVLPDTAEAGQKAGEMIKAKAKADYDQLLYAIVDDAVRKIGKPAPAQAK